MDLLTLMAVLLIEQLRPLPYAALIRRPLEEWADFLSVRLDGTGQRHGAVVWGLGVVAPTLAAWACHALAATLSPALAWGWDILVLYMTMGFRQFSHYFTDLQLALRMGDLAHARALLAEWETGSVPCLDDLSAEEIAYRAIRKALVDAHRHVFGVMLAFLLLPGPSGAVLYRAAAVFAGHGAVTGNLGRFARAVFGVIDALPARLTATGFAVVGNFEAALYRWKSGVGEDGGDGAAGGSEIVLAAGEGALGLNTAADQKSTDVDAMQGAVGLVWRALLLWLLLTMLLTLAALPRAN